MPFKDKLEAIAKTATDKAGDIVETTKLNIKINEEKGKINAHLTEAGRFFYEKFLNGDQLPSEVTDIFCQIRDCEDMISALQEQAKSVRGKE